MTGENEELIFNNALCARVQQLRDGLGLTQAEMAKALGVPPARYAKYENRSPMPAYLWERFALITGTDLHYLVTGKRQPIPIFRPQPAKKRA